MCLSSALKWGTLLCTKSFAGAQFSQVMSAVFAASEVAFFAYVYAKIPKEHYLTVTAQTRASLMIGEFVSSILGQILFTGDFLGLNEISYFSFFAAGGGMLIAISLPRVQQSVYFYRNNDIDELNVDRSTENKDCDGAFLMMWKQIKCAYSNQKVVLWSIWYAFSLCGYLQVFNFVQLLWDAIDDRSKVRLVLRYLMRQKITAKFFRRIGMELLKGSQHYCVH